MAGDQSWFLNFDGMVQSGAVELNAIGGGLFDTTGMISDAINANLGGVFTGTEAEAFVGGFDLIDAINPLNTVEGAVYHRALNGAPGLPDAPKVPK